ncbi:MAG: hypothetical protein WDM96_17825 [Lacunisphaera sp.]
MLALLPLKRTVLFPGLVVTLSVDDPAARNAVRGSASRGARHRHFHREARRTRPARL